MAVSDSGTQRFILPNPLTPIAKPHTEDGMCRCPADRQTKERERERAVEREKENRGEDRRLFPETSRKRATRILTELILGIAGAVPARGCRQKHAHWSPS